MKGTYYIVCGPKKFDYPYAKVRDTLNLALDGKPGPYTLFHGYGGEVDKLANRYANEHCHKLEDTKSMFTDIDTPTSKMMKLAAGLGGIRRLGARPMAIVYHDKNDVFTNSIISELKKNKVKVKLIDITKLTTE